MQEAEALAGPIFQLTGSAPGSREELSTALPRWGGVGLCAWVAEILHGNPAVPRAPGWELGCKHTQEGGLFFFFLFSFFTISIPRLPGGSRVSLNTKEPCGLVQPWE